MNLNLNVFVCIIHLVILSSINAETIPRFDMRDKDGIIFDPIAPRAGERFNATCTLVGLTPNDIRHVTWSLERLNDGKNFTLAVDTDVLQFNQPVPRLRALHNADSAEWTLIFDPLDREDIGNLICRLTDTNRKHVYLKRFLNVVSEPLVLESSTKDIEVKEGSSVVLRCNAQGYPRPTIEWQKADARQLSSGLVRHVGPELHLPYVTSRDTGIYKCLANNLVGFGNEWTLKLSVRFPPVVDCQTDVGQAVNLQVDVYMECYVFGYPPPKITWRKEQGYDIQNVRHYKDISDSQKHFIEATIPEMSICTDCILSRLTIINVEPGDLGNYLINATAPGFPSAIGAIHLYETTDCQQFISNRNKRGCKKVYTGVSSNTNAISYSFHFIFSIVLLIQLF